MLGENHTVVNVESLGPQGYTHTYTRVHVDHQRAVMLDYELTPGQKEALERHIKARVDEAFERAIYDFTMQQPRVDMRDLRAGDLSYIDHKLAPRYRY